MVRFLTVQRILSWMRLSLLAFGLWILCCEAAPASAADSGSKVPKTTHWTLVNSAECLVRACAWYAPAQKPIELQGILEKQELLPPGTLYLSDKTVVLERTQCGQKVTLSGNGLLQVQINLNGSLRFLGAGTMQYEGRDEAGRCAFQSSSAPQSTMIQFPPIQAGVTASNFTISRGRDNALLVNVSSGMVLVGWMDNPERTSQQVAVKHGIRLDSRSIAMRSLEPVVEAVALNDRGGIPRAEGDQFRSASLLSGETQQSILDEFRQELALRVRYGSEYDPGPLQTAWYKVLRYLPPEGSAQAALQMFAAFPDFPLTPEALYQAWARLTYEPALESKKTQLKTDLEAALAKKYAGSAWARAVLGAAQPSPLSPAHTPKRTQ